MKILVKKTLHYYIAKFPLAEKQLQIWHNEFSEMTFNNFLHLYIVVIMNTHISSIHNHHQHKADNAFSVMESFHTRYHMK